MPWFRVQFTESERGWGQKRWYEYYKTYKAAQKAINECNKKNQDDWDKTHVVPDYYIQASDEIVAVDTKPAGA